MKKQLGRNKALVFTILVIAAVLLGFIFHLVISGGKSADQDTPAAGIHESTDPADTGKKSVRAALKTFDVYRLDDLDFAFVIAILDIESPEHQTVTLDHFGASAPAGILFEKFGFTAEHVADTVRSLF